MIKNEEINAHFVLAILKNTKLPPEASLDTVNSYVGKKLN